MTSGSATAWWSCQAEPSAPARWWGAGAIVTRDVPAYTIVVGNPARPVRRRFPEPIAERLERLAWWDWDHERLRRALPDFRGLRIEDFLERYASWAGA